MNRRDTVNKGEYMDFKAESTPFTYEVYGEMSLSAGVFMQAYMFNANPMVMDGAEHVFGFPVRVDPSLPPNVVDFYDYDGRFVTRITDIG